MDEKTMVNDILNGVKSELTTYQDYGRENNG